MYHPGFRAELNRRRREVWGSAVDRLRMLLPRALDRLEAALDGPEGWKVAVQVIKLAGLDTRDASSLGAYGVGPETPDGVIEREARDRFDPAGTLVTPGAWAREQTVAAVLAELERSLPPPMPPETPAPT